MRNFSSAMLLLLPLLLALAPGDLAPSFKAKNQDGKVIKLADFKNKFVLLYFYPMDNTPGCTTEAKNFGTEYAKIKEMNAEVFGVSRQGEKSHKKFKSKYNLPFDLLVDADGSLAKQFGVGIVPVVGFTSRQSILIGPDGKVIRFYDDVDPSTHAQVVLEDIRKASGKAKPKKPISTLSHGTT